MPSPYSRYSTLCQEYGSVLLVQIRTWEALRKPTSPFPTMVLLPGEIEQSWLEVQLGWGRELGSSGVPLFHCPPGHLYTANSRTPLFLPGDVSASACCPGAGIRWRALSLFTACRGRQGER